MSKYLGFWIRKNKNVQVKCHSSRIMADGTELLTICFRNGHVKYVFANQLLEEFVSLDGLLAEITKGSRWVNMSTRHKIQVDEVRIGSGAIFYTIEGVAKKYSHGGIDIQRFKNYFKPEPIPTKESK